VIDSRTTEETDAEAMYENTGAPPAAGGVAMRHQIARRLPAVAPGVFRLAAAATLVAATVPSWAQSQGGPTAAMDGAWHFTIAPYMWATGISGDVSVANLPQVPVDLSFSDVISDVDFAVLGHVEGRKDRFGFGLDVMYVNLGPPVEPDAPVIGGLSLEADVRTTLAEGFLFYRVTSGGRRDNPAVLDVLAGVRYSDSRSRLKATTEAGIEYDGEFQDLDWWDALVGMRFRAPLGSRFALMGRADVAGFGSKLTWNIEGDVGFRASDHWALGAGWRHLDIEYDKGEGLHREVLDIAYDGPRLWFSYSW
jgi:hypothetical protein